MTDTVTDRFLRYVVIDTQSDAKSASQPSTEKQRNLGRLLVEELLAIGIADAHLDEHGYIYATIPSNVDKPVPVICFCSHMDTAPDFTGTHVKPQMIRAYAGGDIQLSGDPQQVIRVSEHPALRDQIGNDLITTDGTTLLGADDKAGIAEIMTAAQILMGNPDIRHGTIKILFTVDEEIGRGVDKVDLQKLGAQFAYTMDGETAGHIEDETFSADGVDITIQGVAIHPGFAKGRMENALGINCPRPLLPRSPSASSLLPSRPLPCFAPSAQSSSDHSPALRLSAQRQHSKMAMGGLPFGMVRRPATPSRRPATSPPPPPPSPAACPPTRAPPAPPPGPCSNRK